MRLRQMKNNIIKVIALVFIISALACLCSCSTWETPYGDLAENGYNVSVRFDVNGGMFEGRTGVFVTDVFNASDFDKDGNGVAEIPVLAIDDSQRGKGAFAATKNSHVLAGWYQECYDSNGNLLTSADLASGKVAAYYAKKWDFETDKVTVNLGSEISNEAPVLTLYAAWVPYSSFEFYVDGESEAYATLSAQTLRVPEWNVSTGKLDMQNFPKINGKTLLGAYTDAECTQLLTSEISTIINEENGTGTASTVRIYTKWQEGTWYKISTAEQLIKIADASGCYEICNDIVFGQKDFWPQSFTNNTFKGTFVSSQGESYSISNITVSQASNANFGGIFKEIGAEAKFENISFENITYNLISGSRFPEHSYGLLAGTIASGATFTNVSIGGEIVVYDSLIPNTDIIGLVCGNNVETGIDFTNVQCVTKTEGSEIITIDVDRTTANGRVTVTVAP